MVATSLPALREVFPAEIECCTCRSCQVAACTAASCVPVRPQDLVLPPIRPAVSHSRVPPARKPATRSVPRALPDPARALTQKPCFDVFRSDAHSASLVHIASSTTRWSAIPLLPLPHARTASTPGNSPTSSNLGFSLEGSDAAAAQRAFELEVGRNGRASPSAAYGTSASSADDEEDDGADADRTQTHRHVCPRCKKRFNRPSSLVAHGRTHTGYKPYVCPFPACGRGFSVHSNMRRHYSTHLNKTEERWEVTPDSPL